MLRDISASKGRRQGRGRSEAGEEGLAWDAGEGKMEGAWVSPPGGLCASASLVNSPCWLHSSWEVLALPELPILLFQASWASQ